MSLSNTFDSFFMGGFECATQVRNDGRRLDLTASTEHDRFVGQDYRLVKSHGLNTVRDGLRWHLIERTRGVYDFSSWLPMLRAARDADVQVVWDICHYGWPDFIDVWSDGFVDGMAGLAEAAARLHREESDAVPFFCPINEISFLAWATAQVGYFFPAEHGRGGEMKRQLVRAAIAASQAIRAVDPRARLMWAEPLINVVDHGEDAVAAAQATAGQFEAMDMIAGLAAPELGGRIDYLDLVGLNYYPHNQWYFEGPTIPMGHHAYRDLASMLVEVGTRYGRPVLLAETGAEGSGRASWLHYVCGEVVRAADMGVRMEGVCLYPIVQYPGWDNERRCETGLLGYADARGRRPIFDPLLLEMERQEDALARAFGAQPPVKLAKQARAA
jgi:hypothetical protein